MKRMLKKLLITDPDYYGTAPRFLRNRLARTLRHTRPDMISYRNKSGRSFAAGARAARHTAKRFGIRSLFINGSLATAGKLGCGVHLTSTQHHLIRRAKSLGLTVLVSTHSKAEIRRCRVAGADFLLYSPVFYVKGKSSPKGLGDLNQITATMRAHIIALGGITSEREVAQIAATKAYGFASIRYFTDYSQRK